MIMMKNDNDDDGNNNDGCNQVHNDKDVALSMMTGVAGRS